MRRFRRLSRFLALGVLLCAAALAPAWADAPTVTMELDQQEVSVGQAAQLTVTVNNGSSSDLTPPAVPGLEFVAIGQSKNMQWVNGSLSSSTSVIYQVMAQQPGLYKIPSMTPGTPPLSLRVVPDGSLPSAGQAQSSGSAQAAGNAAADQDGGAARGQPQGLTFARLVVHKNAIYVGETVPVDIELGIQAGIRASLDGMPSLTGDAFVVSPLSSRPVQEVRNIGDKQYTTVTWHGTLTALKPGSYPLTVEIPATVEIPPSLIEPRARSTGSPFDDAFNDPFFQRFRPPIEKQLKITSAPQSVAVIPLPAEGRPADFSGAVGQFTVSSDLSDRTVAVGDPVSLRLHVSGTGTFDRVDSTMLGSVAGWKAYRPNAKFTPDADRDDRGEKIFEQAIVATRAGPNTVPALNFSFFDPQAKRYETRSTAPIQIDVTPGEGAAGTANSGSNSAPASATTAATPPASAASSTDASDGLRPDRVETGATIGSLLPLYLRPGFLALQLGIVLLFGAIGLGVLGRRLLAARQTAQREHFAESVEAALAEMRQAAAASDARRFFEAARRALQRRLAKAWQLPPRAVTIAEIDARLPATAAPIREIFVLADEAAYSGRQARSADLQQWTATVMRQLETLESI